MSADPMRVVVADDDADIRELVTFKLRQAGYDIDAVADGAQAWATISEAPPRLAVLDVMMPGLSGLDVLRKIRDDEHTKTVPIILLTARSRDIDIDAGFASGATDYVAKPFSPRELVRRVTSVLDGEA